MTPGLLLAAVVLQASPSPAATVSVDHLVLSAPAVVIRLREEDMRGEPVRLCWSPDGRELYVGTLQRDRWGNTRPWHYLVTLSKPAPVPLDGEPHWFARCWLPKAGLAAPGLPESRIEVESREQMVTPTRPDGAGSLAQSSDPSGLGALMGVQGSAISSIAQQAQRVVTTTFRLRGQTLAEFVNTTAIPGLTYGWAPGGTGLIAYGDKKGRLVLMDQDGRRREVAAASRVRLPVWSADGRRLAWVERVGRDTFEIDVMSVQFEGS
jgi:hypothetical protein